MRAGSILRACTAGFDYGGRVTEPAPATPATPSQVATGTSQRARRRTLVALPIAVTFAVLLTMAVVTDWPALDAFDDGLTDVTRGWADRLGWPVDVAWLIGKATAPFWSAAAVGVVVLILWRYRYRAAAGLLALSAIAGVTTSEIMKRAIGRTRPPGAEEFQSDMSRSFPSGHSMAGIYLYVATGLVLIHLGTTRGVRWLVLLGRTLVVLGPAIGVSRLILGVHWPSDILAGWALGSVVLLAAALILWWPVDRGWRQADAEAGATPPAPPGAGTTPAAPGR